MHVTAEALSSTAMVVPATPRCRCIRVRSLIGILCLHLALLWCQRAHSDTDGSSPTEPSTYLHTPWQVAADSARVVLKTVTQSAGAFFEAYRLDIWRESDHRATQGAAAQNAFSLVSGSLWTLVERVDYVQNLVYCSLPLGLMILDVTDSSVPLPRGRLLIPDGSAHDLAVSDGIAILARRDAGLYVVDVSNPAKPLKAAQINLPGEVTIITANGDYCYAVSGTGSLVIIDVSDPYGPKVMSTYESSCLIRDISADGNQVHLACNDSGVLIIDVSNPSFPSRLARYNLAGNAASIVIQGMYAYAYSQTRMTASVEVLDISNPLSVLSLGHIDDVGTLLELAIEGDFLYTAANDDGMTVVDVSNKSDPTIAARFVPGSAVHGIAVGGVRAFVAEYNRGIHVLDVSHPATPWSLGKHFLADVINNVSVANDYAYVTTDETGLAIIDMSDPEHPTLASVYETPGRAFDVAVQAPYAYVADGAGGGLQILDISVPDNPFPVGSFATSSAATGVCVHDTIAYVADDDTAVVILNVANPMAPVELGRYPTPSFGIIFTVSDERIYVSDRSGGLRVVDASDPVNPSLIGVYDSVSEVNGICVQDHLAFVSERKQGLVVLDISNPSQPSYVSSWDPGEPAWALAVANNYAYLGTASGSLQLKIRAIDVSDPAMPELYASFSSLGLPLGIDAVDTTITVAAFAGVLTIELPLSMDVREEEAVLPTSPASLLNFPNPFNPGTKIRFHLLRPSHVVVTVRNTLGRQVATLCQRRMDAGWHELAWDGSDQQGRGMPSGVYICQVRTDEFVRNRKMLLLR